MLAHALAPALARRGIHYGWVMVAVTFLVMVSTAAALGVLGAFLLPLQREFGWETGAISGALGLRLMLFGLLAPFAAALIARHGIRAMVGVALVLIVGGLLSSLAMTSLWQLWLFWGAITGIGTGLTAMVLGATVANRWFSSRRGLVLGLLTASTATGQLAFLPFAAWMAEHAGWRVALLPPLGLCVLAGLLMWLFGRERPDQLGLQPYGLEGPPVAAPPAAPATGAIATALSIGAEAARTPVFWILFATFFICGLSTNGLIQTHFIPLCGDYGMGSVEAASVLAMMGVFDVVGTVLSGWLSDRYDNRALLCWYYGLRGLSLLFLPSSTFSIWGLSLFAVFYGLDWIATVPPTVKLAGQAFGRDKAPVVFGWVFTGHQIGAATAAFGAGLTRDALLTYLPAFYAAGAACLAASAAVWMIGRGRRDPLPRSG